MVEANPNQVNQVNYASVGIDLGTTNSAVAIVKPTVEGDANVETL